MKRQGRKRREEILAEMLKLGSESDYESAHAKADDLLVELLLIYGEELVVDAYNNVGKWYA